MAEEIRRSGRATKGQHTKKDEETEKAPKKKGRGKAKKTAEPEPEDEEEESIIRCICGYVKEDESDKRAMICCDKCEAWQHNVCMGMPTDEDDCPDQYFCEQCHPQDHKGLLEGIKRGEKLWLERQSKHDQEEVEAKAKKRKGGRPGRKSKGPEVETTPSTSKAVSPVAEKPPESGTKRKAPDLAVDTAPGDKASSKSRKVTTPQETKPAKRRQSTAAPSTTTPVRKDSSKIPLQAELVENIADLQNANRQRAAKALDKLFAESVDAAQKEGAFKRSGQSSSELGLRLALTVEYALYLNLWGNAEEPAAQYGAQLRAILHNIKANTSLRDRVIKTQLTANELSQMSSFDMASKEKQEETAKIVKDAEKQHVLINEQGPRIRRTHKGDELVEQDGGNMQSTSIYSNAPVHGGADGGEEKGQSPGAEPGSPNMVELPEDVAAQGDEGGAGRGKPERKSSSNFNIDNVWGAVDSPTSAKPRASSTTQRPPRPAGVKADPEIDSLLKDEDDDEPYSPMEYEMEPGTVWRGTVQMATVAEFRGSAKFVAGADLSTVHPWGQLMPPTLYVEGRIDTDKAGEYLCGLRFSNTTDVTVISLTPAESADDEAQFDKLFAYFTDRRRYGVVGKSRIALVRDIYVVPLEAGDAPKPDFIELLRDCDIPATRPRRSLLITYVIKVRAGDAAGQQPGGAAQGSPVPPHSAQFRTPSLPHSLVSPIAGAPGGLPGQAGSAIPGGPHPHPGSPPLDGQHGAQWGSAGLTGMAAAQAVLGPLAAEPVIPQLLAHSPNVGEYEFTHIKRAMEQTPDTRHDLAKLMQSIQAMMSGA